MRTDVLISGVLQSTDLPYTTPWIPTVGLAKVIFIWSGIEDVELPSTNVILDEAINDDPDTANQELFFSGGVFGSYTDTLGTHWHTEWTPAGAFIRLNFSTASDITLPIGYSLRGISY